MKMQDCGIYILITLIVMGIGVATFSKKQDSPTEQFIEKVIKDEFGVDVDFSPENE